MYIQYMKLCLKINAVSREEEFKNAKSLHFMWVGCLFNRHDSNKLCKGRPGQARLNHMLPLSVTI